MKINKLTVGMLSTNCYLIITDSGNGIVVDPGGSFSIIRDAVKDIHISAILLTHGHYDHISAVNELVELTSAPVYIHEADNEMILSAEKSLSSVFADEESFTPIEGAHLLHDGDTVSFDELTFAVMHTPGHTKGSCIYYGHGVMFSGDTLFRGTIGRTDHYGGDHSIECASVKRIATLDGDYTVLSGHGEQTTLDNERHSNPYMGTNYDDIF